MKTSCSKPNLLHKPFLITGSKYNLVDRISRLFSRSDILLHVWSVVLKRGKLIDNCFVSWLRHTNQLKYYSLFQHTEFELSLFRTKWYLWNTKSRKLFLLLSLSAQRKHSIPIIPGYSVDNVFLLSVRFWSLYFFINESTQNVDYRHPK